LTYCLTARDSAAAILLLDLAEKKKGIRRIIVMGDSPPMDMRALRLHVCGILDRKLETRWKCLAVEFPDSLPFNAVYSFNIKSCLTNPLDYGIRQL
jgi:hypothetical protein